MGLDIRVYKNIKFVDKKIDEEDDRFDHCLRLFNHKLFHSRSDGIEQGFYKGKDIFHFKAGNYSGYNEWRDLLSNCMLGVSAKIICNQKEYQDKPFYELINFSDCEGFIGPETSKKLYNDFTQNKDKFPVSFWITDVYDNFTKAFMLAASHQGIVLFS